MPMIRYTLSWFETDCTGNSRAKFEAGKLYPVTDESLSHVAQGVAEQVDAPDADVADAVAADEAPAEDVPAEDAATAAAEQPSARKTRR